MSNSLDQLKATGTVSHVTIFFLPRHRERQPRGKLLRTVDGLPSVPALEDPGTPRREITIALVPILHGWLANVVYVGPRW